MDVFERHVLRFWRLGAFLCAVAWLLKISVPPGLDEPLKLLLSDCMTASTGALYLQVFLKHKSSTSLYLDLSRFDTELPVLDPERNLLLAGYGSKMLASSADNFDKWSRAMSRDLGSWVGPYLPQVWGQATSDAVSESRVPLSCRILDSLIASENASLTFQLDISSENVELREQNLVIYRALGQKIARTSELIRKEAGLRSLWLGYPLLIAHDLSDPEDPTIVLAPLLLWAVDIQVSLSRQGQIRLARDPKVGPPSLNKALQTWVKKNLHVDLSDCGIEDNGSGPLTRERHSSRSTNGIQRRIGITRINVGQTLLNPSRSFHRRRKRSGLPQPAILNSAVLGIFAEYQRIRR